MAVQAIQFNYSDEGIKELKEFCGDVLIATGKDRTPFAVGWAQIGTLEDGFEGSPQVKHIAREGDYIVKGPAGEFWPVRKGIFEETYEEYFPDEKYALYKISHPGYSFKTNHLSEIYLKAYSIVCSECMESMPDFNKDFDNLSEEQLLQSIHELMSTACGCEFIFEESNE